MSGQTLNDRLTAARHTLAGQGLARVVCKATTEEVIGPKKKHLDYLLHCTNEPNVSIPQLANLLIERTQHASWVVVFKALITVHHLMCYGNERFTQYLASSNCTFQLSNFLDKSSVQSAYDMSTFIRRYAKYLNEKALSYRTVAFDFCKVKRGKDDGMLRTMNTDKLLKTLPALQGQLDALLEFDCTSNDLTNGVINSSFMLLFRDLIRLFACYNDGIINLLEKYFDMNKKNCREALDIYKKFLIRMDRVAEFLKVAENVGIDKGDIPDLTKAPSSLLDALEQHLNALEGKKGATTASAASRSANLKNAVSALSSTSSAFGNAAAINGAANTTEVNGIKLDDAAARKALEEEAAVMNQLKFEDESSQIKWEQPCWDDVERRMREVQGSEPVTKTNPFLASPTPESQPPSSQGDGLVDLFSSPTATNASAKASDDLLCLSGNPFADSLFGGGTTSPQQQQPAVPPTQFMPFGSNGFAAAPAPTAGTFASDASFAAVFGSSNDTSPIYSSPLQAAQGFATSAPKPAATPEVAVHDSLTLPVSDPFAARSTSPSPTAEMMRGAGTTPILTHGPDVGFAESNESGDDGHVHSQAGGHSTTISQPTSDSVWGTGVAKTDNAGFSPFGAPFEPSSGAGAHNINVTSTNDLFGGLDGTIGDFSGFGQKLPASGLSAPPPSPFGLVDSSGVNLDMRSASPNQQMMLGGMGNLGPHSGASQQPSQAPQQPKSAFDDLNFAIQKAMIIPGPKMSLSQASSTQSLSSSAPGVGLPNQAIAFQATQSPSASMTTTPIAPRLDGVTGMPMARASPTTSFGTPPSGLSSPAKSVSSGVGGGAGGAFDAFGDVLQPMSSLNATKTVNGTDNKAKGATGLIKGDLDSSLASLAQNLDINGPKQSLKKGPGGHQWGSPKVSAKTGGTSWGPGAPPAGAVPGAAPPAQGMQPGVNWTGNQQFPSPGGTQWGNAGGMMAGPFPTQPTSGMLPNQNFGMAKMRPMAPAGMGMGMMGMGAPVTPQMAPPTTGSPMNIFGSTAPMAGPPMGAAVPPVAPAGGNFNDPFGAL